MHTSLANASSTLTNSPILGFDMWSSSFSFDMDPLFDINFDDFTKLPSSTTFETRQWNLQESIVTSDCVYQHNGIIGTADDSNLFDSSPSVHPRTNLGELHAKAQKLFDPSNKFPANQIFQLVLYFSSNNLLSEEQTDVFLKWAIEQKYVELLSTFLEYKSPTVCAFASKILESVVRIVEPEVLTLLLKSSIDSRVLSGVNGGELLRNSIKEMWYNWNKIDCQRYIKVTKLLLERDADPNPPKTDKDHGTPFLYAVLSDNREIIELLVKAGADVNAELEIGIDANTALASAVDHDSLPMTLLLLELGAKIENSYINGIPILAWTAAKSPRIYNILLSASKNSPDKINVPGILHASRTGTSCLSNYLHGGKDLPETKVKELLESALTIAIYTDPKSPRPLQALLDIGVDPNVPTQEEECPLEITLSVGALEVANLLLKGGADPNAPGIFKACADNFDALELVINHGGDVSAHGGNALYVASSKNSYECIVLLIESGADINSRAQDFSGNPTSLQYITQGYTRSNDPDAANIETAKFLIENGANVNAPASMNNGYTALQAAAKAGNYGLVDYYLGVGANVNAASAKIGGMAALEAAAQIVRNGQEKQKIFHLLVKAGALMNRDDYGSKCPSTTSTLHILIETRSMDLTCYAIDAGADINFTTCEKEGRTPLQLAAEKGQLDIVRILLQKGALVNFPATSNFGRTALQAAAFCETPCIEVIKLLLENGAEVNAKAGIVGGVTALQASAIRGHIPIALLLLEKGADVNAKPAIKKGRTAIEGAAEHGRLDMVQLLIDAGATGDVGTGFKKATDAAERNCHFAVADMLKEHQIALDAS
ncbi:hypothetical protein G7Y89_g4839 [Cudoniella acicularis]|uniref:Uncharacterized protein n=1 Tax=Cudoniella acicularis TaxID=354080 RepID=A0A8H4RQU1_9HELO|nr:hypothetical protein G7Y89_g4839 [Cudoniella acicularis]